MRLLTALSFFGVTSSCRGDEHPHKSNRQMIHLIFLILLSLEMCSLIENTIKQKNFFSEVQLRVSPQRARRILL